MSSFTVTYKFLAISLLLIFSALKSFADERDILVIESYHSGYKWSQDCVEAISSSLSDYTVQRFQMDTKRISPVMIPARADQAWQVIKAVEPALVFLNDDNALKYLSHRLSKTEYPVVYLGINSNPRKTGIFKFRNITGILERPLLKRAVINVKKIIPELEKALILFDDSTTSRHISSDFFQNKTKNTIGSVETDLFLSNDINFWKEQINSAKKNNYQAIWVGTYFTIHDENDKNVSANQVIEWASNNSPLPLFGFWDFSVGKDKSIGGLVMTGKSQGLAAAEIAKRILSGTKPESILPQMPKKGEYIFSKKQLDKWKVTLPDNIRLNSTIVE